MIISPPFIPVPVAGETDEAFVERAMPGGNQGDGAYPLSFDLNWHGGLHLQAPQENGKALPVRAIADGTLAFFRAPTEKSTDPKHALNYGEGWTDDGCIVLRHETEIGEGARSQVVFFSIYMHLSKINITNPQINQRIYRKDSIGEAGQIYGSAGKIHFEIIASDTQVEHLTGRRTRELDYRTHDGRTDSCWGDMYFYVPSTLQGFAAPPSNFASPTTTGNAAFSFPALPAGWLTPSGSPSGLAITTTQIDGYRPEMVKQMQQGLIVRMRYDKGQCQLTTYHLTGELIGSQSEDSDFEYNLYTTATRRYPACPSAGYELLRFGRVLGPDALQPANAAHWRKISLPPRTEADEAEHSAWFNLNAAGVTRFSDADFPHWMGWRLIDDDQDSDSHCQSTYIRDLLEPPSLYAVQLPRREDAVSRAQSDAYNSMPEGDKRRLSEQYMDDRLRNTTYLVDATARGTLKRLICKFPTEWSSEDFNARYGWLTKVAEGGPMSEDDFKELKKHQKALAFWEDSNLTDIDKKHWHFPPREIISIFRGCGWLTANEFAMTFPKHMFYNTNSNPITPITTNSDTYTISRERAKERIARHSPSLNKVIRKYLGGNKHRISIFLAQTLLETAQWRDLGGSKRLMHEWGFGAYSAANPATQFYTIFYGRGIMQLTWAGNYREYGNYRAFPPNSTTTYTERRPNTDARLTATSQHYSAHPNNNGSLFTWSPRFDPDIIGERPYEACDSGGVYWISKPFSEGININRVADRPYSASNIGLINRLVNGGSNGYYERQAYTVYMLRSLTDSVDTSREVTITPPHPKHPIRANMQAPE